MKLFFLVLLLPACASLPPQGKGSEATPKVTDVYRTIAPEPARSLPGDEIRMTVVGGTDILELAEDTSEKPVLGNRAVVEVAPTGNPRQWKVTGKTRGMSSVIFRRHDGSVLARLIYNVTLHELSKQVIAIRRLLDGIQGITVEAVGDHVVVDGKIMEPKQLDRILRVQDAYGSLVVNLVELDPRLYEERALRMESEIRKDAGGQHVRVIYLNDTYLLVGTVERAADRERAETIVQLLLPEIMARPSHRENILILGAKKYSIRNLIEVAGK